MQLGFTVLVRVRMLALMLCCHGYDISVKVLRFGLGDRVRVRDYG